MTNVFREDREGRRMNGLTQKDEQGNWSLRGVPWEGLHEGKAITKELWERLYGALWKLMEYEDTGLTPGQLKESRRWITVEERLPEDGTYLCTLDGELCGLDEPFTGMCGIENGRWDEEGCVIAWMPLPEPYSPQR